MNDSELLQAYAAKGSQEAFRALIDRYVRLVYGACLRQLGDRHLAEDATQGVFVLLSQKAGELKADRISGWLLTAARYACANMRKGEGRRLRREAAVAAERQMVEASGSASAAEETHGEMLAELDEGLCALPSADREAVVLRYMHERPLRQVGLALGVSEEAARKRVDRGLAKLRHYFMRRGIEAGVVVIGAVLTEQARAAALTPVIKETMVQGIWQACQAGAAGSAKSVAIAKGIKMVMVTTKLKIGAALTAAAAVVIVAGVWGISAALAERAPAGPVVAAAPVAQAPAAPATPTAAVTVTIAPAAPAMAKADGLVIDRSTPENALGSMALAVKAGDRDKACECVKMDPAADHDAFDYAMAMSLAQSRVVLACQKSFGGDGEYSRRFFTIDQAIGIFMLANTLTGNHAKITGDTATLQLAVPDGVVKNMGGMLSDPGVKAVLKQWSGKSVYFVKVDGKWQLDCAKSIVVVTTVWGKNNQRITDAETIKAATKDYENVLNTVAEQVRDEKLPGWDEANGLWNKLYKEMQDKYNVMWIDSGVVPPEDAGK